MRQEVKNNWYYFGRFAALIDEVLKTGVYETENKKTE
jgi:hypothetical protein